MRIAIFSECYTPVTNGVVTSITTLRETMRSWGHRVYVFAPGAPQPDDDADVFRLPELPFPRHPYHFARPFPRLNVNFAALNIQIVHCQHPFTVGRLGAETARKHGVPMVYTAHSLYDSMAACAKSPLVRSMGPKAMRGVMRRFCAKADYVIAPSRYTRDALRADLAQTRCLVVPSGVLPPKIGPEDRAATRALMGLHDDTPLLLYVGRLGPEKRIDVLLKSVAALRQTDLPPHIANFKVALVGDGQCRSELEELTEHLGLSDRVKFVGGVPHNNVGQWYAAGDIFTMPSPAETQGLVLVEAMSAGLPCITVDQGGPRELVLQGRDRPADSAGHRRFFPRPRLPAALAGDSPFVRGAGPTARPRLHARGHDAPRDDRLSSRPAPAQPCQRHECASPRCQNTEAGGRNAGPTSRRRPRSPPPRLKILYP